MFHCAQGHISRPGDMRILVVSQVRPVRYSAVKTVYDRKEEELKEIEVSSSHGSEIAEETAFCSLHARAAEEWFTPPALTEGETKEVATVL
ncbi:MAG: hypothetical protein WDZ40_03515 [Candidatus Spechtbacterales bacterium]